MKKIHPIALWVAGSLLVAIFACNDPTVIGSDLLAGDQLDIEFTDTITVNARTITGDSVRTFAPLIIGSDIQSFLCGYFQDPIFGSSLSYIYAHVSESSSLPDFADAELDSMVFVLPWQPDDFYGRTSNEIFDLDIFELAESLNQDSVYYSNQSFEVKPGAIGHIQFTPNATDSVTLAVPGDDSVFVRVEPQLRIPLNETFSNEFFTAAESNFSTDSLFLAFFKGIRISPASQNAGMLSFNLRSSIAGIRVYYHKDTVYDNYFFPIFTSDVVTTYMENDHIGSISGAFADATAEDDSLLFLQGMEGLSVEVEIPYVEDFEKVIVNRAELEFTVEKLMQDLEDYDPVGQVIISEIVDDTTKIIIDDVQMAINRAGNKFNEIFGGDFDSSDNTYKLNITSHFQSMMDGSKTKKLLVTVYNRAEHPSRVVLAGPGHSAHPVKLNVSFTRY